MKLQYIKTFTQRYFMEKKLNCTTLCDMRWTFQNYINVTLNGYMCFSTYMKLEEYHVYRLKKRRDQRCKKFGIRREERIWGGKINWRRIADRFHDHVQIWQLELFFQPTVASLAKPLSRLLLSILMTWEIKERMDGKRRRWANIRGNTVGMDRNDERAERGHRIPLRWLL